MKNKILDNVMFCTLMVSIVCLILLAMVHAKAGRENTRLRYENVNLRNEVNMLKWKAPKSQIAADIMSDYIRLSKDSGDFDGFHEWCEVMPLDSLGITEEEILNYSFCY